MNGNPAAGDTIFHRIMRREIPADIVHEDEHLIAFRDIAPQAPVHVLFVPKEPIPTLDDLHPGQAATVGRLVVAAADYARREGLAADGYRMVMNCNGFGGQTVFQLHLHLLAGAPLGRFGTPG
ncbi:MAG TPA: histidine triad nucleotide-binding protein [Xanthomonadaceae bacterium]|nr:histidine triad nucleotide-binding protein [Xanthomonadaceae bacterium]